MIFYILLTFFYFSPPQQLGPVIQPLTFNYDIKIDKVPERHKENFLQIQKSYEPFIKEYESKTTNDSKYLFKMLNNTQISRIGLSTAINKDVPPK